MMKVDRYAFGVGMKKALDLIKGFFAEGGGLFTSF